MVYRIQYGSAPGSSAALWYGKGWRPYASKASAIKLHSREAAEERLADLRRIWAANPEFAAYLIDGARIVEGTK